MSMQTNCEITESDAWLTRIRSVSINILAEVEQKLGAVEWQLQLLAVLPEEAVLISINLRPLFYVY